MSIIVGCTRVICQPWLLNVGHLHALEFSRELQVSYRYYEFKINQALYFTLKHDAMPTCIRLR